MAAIIATKVLEMPGLVASAKTGTPLNLMVVEIEATTTATSNTLDLTTVIPCTGIKQIFAETIDEAVAATSNTWSGTTVTFASHAGSGRYTGTYLITQ